MTWRSDNVVYLSDARHRDRRPPATRGPRQERAARTTLYGREPTNVSRATPSRWTGVAPMLLTEPDGPDEAA